MNPTLLIELGVEELPPAAMRPLADAFAQGLARGLADAGLAPGPVTRYATPRRLAVAIADVPTETAATTVEKAGPTVAIAFDNQGNPTAAAEGFARSVGVSVDALTREASDKGERLVHRAPRPGRPLSALLQPALDAVLRSLPIPKRMRWGNSESVFVRPVHWLLSLHGDTCIPLKVFDISSDRLTFGHRFHYPHCIDPGTADDYAEQLRDPGFVIVDPDDRKQRIADQIATAAARMHGQALVDDALLEEVTALVEWPVAIAGQFDKRFLSLPREVLISTLQTHQRYFPLVDKHHALQAGFITVANIESTDVAQVIAGNERVVRPRLADALFFWDQDQRQGLDVHIDALARVSFHNALGSLADKSARVRTIARQLTSPIGADPDIVDRAAILAKTDLLTEMVGEFPDLQGIMGRYYALEAGEPEAVAEALAQQYAPAQSGAGIAASPAGQTLALADRLDTLAGIFAIDKRPSGDRDPFALRRAALGVLRTLIEAGITLDLKAALNDALDRQPVTAPEGTLEALWLFHVERLRGYYAEQGYATALFESVAGLDITDVLDFDRRIRAVATFTTRAAARVVCGAHKRVRNILKRNANAAIGALQPDLFVETEENELADALATQGALVAAAVAAHDYDRALASLAELAGPLDRFFDQVMVMSKNNDLQHNRLALLTQVDALCRQVADISCLSLQ